ncbi:family 20 glycosylhydrolase [Asinibacterium sp. OR53]|uniref:glycoside hydrolase family 20 protein n=1 Tax=Asinibacterium sp. OR53 TaxID=925409 RepID=UPI00047CDF72|nr:family 20 glycosylhydrolase [Asinibacterium sp. OR53]
MLRSKLFLLLAGLPMLVFAQETVSIIPKPVSLQLNPGHFIIDEHSSIHYRSTEKDLAAAAHFLQQSIKTISGYTLPSNKTGFKTIQLVLKDTLGLGNEGYFLQVTNSGITIRSGAKAGIIYGIQSLLQTLPATRTNAVLRVPAMQVTDYPRFKWRGMHLDVSRHFFSADVVKEYIDLMASYKMNVFHWHLCDDQGWRLEIKKYPKLTTVGAWRVERPGKNWSDREPAKAGEAANYGGYYTQEQVKEIIAYAKERNVTIVPEIEMPGHSAAAIAAYPQLACSPHPQMVVTGGQYPKDNQSNYCPGNDSVFVFLQDVLKEVADLFPSQYIHVGGDEVDKSDWKKCPKCQARIKQEGLKDENELQSYLIRRIEKYLLKLNKKLIGWDEILEGGLAPEATVMSWRGESGGIEAAKMKHNVVMTPGSPCYFDHYQAGPEGEPLAIGGFNTLHKVYDYEPIPKELNGDEEKYVLGAQGNVWTEFIPTTEHLEYMVLPRMLALAEVLWSPKGSKDWEGFSQRLQYHFNGFDQKGLHYCKGNFTVNIKPASKDGKLKVSLATEATQGDIYYTLNGAAPNTGDHKYQGPIDIDSSVTIKAVTVLNGNVMGVKPAEQSFVMHKGIGSNVVYEHPVSKYYTADGPNSLTDGVRGTEAVGKFWHGFNGKDLVATVDLGMTRDVQYLSLGCLQRYRDWIFLPQSVLFETSVDGTHYTALPIITHQVSVNEKTTVIHDFVARFAARKIRYIRATAKSIGVCPKGHSGEGQPAWIFADELIVN